MYSFILLQKASFSHIANVAKVMQQFDTPVDYQNENPGDGYPNSNDSDMFIEDEDADEDTTRRKKAK